MRITTVFQREFKGIGSRFHFSDLFVLRCAVFLKRNQVYLCTRLRVEDCKEGYVLEIQFSRVASSNRFKELV